MISKRLEACAAFTQGFNCLLDVGSDHAYLPIFAVSNNYVKCSIASDVAVGPIANANKNIFHNHLEDRIKTIVEDGIPKTDADLISITGMGGILIISILKKTLHNAENCQRIILSPNNNCPLVRAYMLKNFHIVDETIIKEQGHFYEVMVFEKGFALHDEYDIEYGPLLRLKKSDLFIEKYQKRYQKLCEIEKQISNIDKLKIVQKEKEMLNYILT